MQALPMYIESLISSGVHSGPTKNKGIHGGRPETVCVSGLVVLANHVRLPECLIARVGPNCQAVCFTSLT